MSNRVESNLKSLAYININIYKVKFEGIYFLILYLLYIFTRKSISSTDFAI
jgi:hypothetical protein